MCVWRGTACSRYLCQLPACLLPALLSPTYTCWLISLAIACSAHKRLEQTLTIVVWDLKDVAQVAPNWDASVEQEPRKSSPSCRRQSTACTSQSHSSHVSHCLQLLHVCLTASLSAPSLTQGYHSVCLSASCLLSVCLSACLSSCLLVCLRLCLSLRLSLCFSVCPSFCLSLYLSPLSLALFMCLFLSIRSACLTVFLSLYLSVCLFDSRLSYLSICLP